MAEAEHLAPVLVSDHANEQDSSDDDEPLKYGDPDKPSNADELYDHEMDEENEAYVYKHLRGGTEETIAVASAETTVGSGDGQASARHLPEQLKVLKPRNSDAILSCPCCFQIVCMDCQKHERYVNQYRAMFVMNIGVHWQKRYKYDLGKHELVEIESTPAIDGGVNVVQDVSKEKEEIYYSVYCLNCNTEVAVLNMEDEVYHFTGCLASTG
uniref:E2F-associated phosphoprotein n=1 Tax=Leptocylindrus danicus TaxID=163516 RepID=A0A6U2TTH1_9STRA|mmetsp:Transcript_976/g.1375  ORF Transcript_976/g.1375 Transcript_976/m.1375 type:complete len:212 (+) Transcript_976:142-777(+)